METIHRIQPVTYRNVLFVTLFVACLLPVVDAPIALLLGFVFTQAFGNPFAHLSHKSAQILLKISVVGLGFGMNLNHAIEAGREGLLFTVFSIVLTLLGGLWLGKKLGIEPKSSFLITAGTAICGGSAIAALSPLIKANEKQISAALGVVFVLNAVALFIFPMIGHWAHLSQHNFGIWSAIAIHDTSSVVGASARFGAEALQTATTIKLERALWIIPLSIITMLVNRKNGATINFPYFIGLFILAVMVSNYFTEYQFIYSNLLIISKKLLVLTMFLIGAGLNLDNIKAVGIKPFLQGIILWAFVSAISLFAVIVLN
ncbi:putative sulfate exporter family transporter [Dyadobacter sp. CY345]|uniref:YeiH family protein n=1 Tax=Dyadobacter sp. CY345 TaxID=2909335 RepID=UPI001F42D17A|nr:putative sulfate exporter family transporter [Dyadobacter sp. CY345]MCF2446177.1 putative sulfate exporter family transporter [Dyadobacter sp. CY345]